MIPIDNSTLRTKPLMRCSVLRLRRFFCLLFICFSCLFSFAQGDGGITKTIGKKKEGSEITSNSYVPAVIYVSEPNEIVNAAKIVNNITLEINENLAGLDNFTAVVTVIVQYGDDVNSTTEMSQQNLTVNYAKGVGVKYNAQNRITFEGAKFVRIGIANVSVSSNTASAATIISKLILLNEMTITRYYDLSDNNVPAPEFKLAQAEVNGELPVIWKINVTPGNNGTQLEWTWLSDEMASVYAQDGTVNTDLLFINNATRVDLSPDVNLYNIPLLYEGIGKVYYRVRFVNNKANGSRSDGPWSEIRNYSFIGHQNNLNWQATTSFAEGGKRKSVVQYYDGSLRQRQTVTKNNTDNTVVVAETLYDQQGRPAIQILPSPEMSNTIAYINDLNLFNGQTGSQQNPAELFDLQSAVTPPALQPYSGAASYYSPTNPTVSDSANPNFSLAKKIPDAQGYPYTLTRYTPDVTGRILSQSGVGETFKAGGGHDTKYFYGSPSQEELDGLFGTEAGNAAHYFKNMVQDANGQMSISYVDMHGRTVATALAGDAPPGMTSLLPDAASYPNQDKQTLTKNLLKPGSNLVKDNNRIESVNTLLVPYATSHTFNYQLTPSSFQTYNCDNTTTACYDCLYNLEISITDESGESSPTIYTFSNISLAPDNDCSTAPLLLTKTDNTSEASVSGNTITITKTLSAGSYTIRKTLTVSDAGREQQKQAFLTKALCKTEQDIIDSIYLVEKGITGCELTPTPVSDCPGNLCNPQVSHTLESIKQQMLADMIPYSGQYALAAIGETSTNSSLFSQYNIFASNAFRNPWNSNNTADYYLSGDGVPDPVLYPAGTTTSALPVSISKEFFESHFSFSWADALLPHHPEYARYKYAVANLTPSYDWINGFINTAAYADANATGFVYQAGSSTTTPYNDPYHTLAGAGDRTTMENWVKKPGAGNTGYLSSGFSIWQIASGNVTGCKLKTDANTRNSCYVTTPVPGDAAFNNLTTTEKDAIWENFKNLYANERNNLVNTYITSSVPFPDAPALVNDKYNLYFTSSRQQAAQVMNWQGYPATDGAAPSLPAGQDDAADVYSGRCSGYIAVWKTKLLQCKALASRVDVEEVLNEITSRMQAVCMNGSNEANPFGSSTVAPSTPAYVTDRSFEDVIQNVFIEKGIIGSNGIYTDGYCNPFVIDYPKPFNKAEQVIPEVTGTVDTCNCRLFQNIKTEAGNAGYDPGDFTSLNQYLQLVYKETITKPLFDVLSSCSVSGTQSCTTTYDTSFVHYNCDDPAPVCGGSSFSRTSQSAGSDQNTPTTNLQPGECIKILACPTSTCNTITVYALPTPQPLPRFLQCGYMAQSLCHTCGELQQLTAQFKAAFAAPFNNAPKFQNDSILTDYNIDYNLAWERFVNYRTGMQETWQTYAAKALANNCTVYNSGSTSTASVICARSLPLNDTTGIFVKAAPCAHTFAMAVDMGQNIYAARKAQLLADFDASYRSKCLSSVSDEVFTVTYQQSEYHYTLYYYDQAGNLVKTVPPNGVRPDFSTAFLNAVKSARTSGAEQPRPHLLTTRYCYNSLNAVTAQSSPDGGISNFWYDRLGRLTVSRNAKQAAAGKWSYTIYDNLGRINEVGQKPQATAMTQAISQDTASLSSWLNGTGTREQITYTIYDSPYLADATSLSTYIRLQQNLRNRVSYTMVKNSETDAQQYAATFYTYDIHGNVDTLLQDFAGVAAMSSTGNRFKRITYDYDLISGKVNAVDYQPPLLNTAGTYDAQADAFYHRYTYDAENRLTEVETSRDKLVWETDAAYSYYRHGPLARVVTGALQVQGSDYTYTLQGWLKGVNGSTDEDGAPGSPVARDAYSYQLNYYSGDYKGIDGTNPSAAMLQGLGSAFKPLYNGNIAAMGVNITKLSQPAMVYNYGYDQLNRLRTMDALTAATNGFGSLTAVQAYKEAITYDPNGNIITYLRNGANLTNMPLQMDNLTYTYKPGTNQLTSIADVGSYANNYGTSKNGVNDIDNQAANNYRYDEIGNMTSDVKEGVTGISWNVYGKILNINRSSGSIAYTYDASGNRISKTSGSTVTTYVRDAQGNVMAVYQKAGAAALKKTESHIYGSSRLGIADGETVAPVDVLNSSNQVAGRRITFTRGEKAYELTNHLGNVLVSISDKRLVTVSNGSITSYTPDVVSASDYYPFGMQMPGRTLTAANYRYGFNGKENDNEVKGDGNQIDYGFRIYDPRGGRFLSVDPLIGQYPQLTPYQYASNRPIDGIDIDGLEWGPPHGANGKIDDDAALQMMHANSEMAIGFYESGKGTIVGALSALKHPVRTINGIANAIAHPINTFNAVKNQYVQEFDDNAAKASGKIGGDIFQLLFGGEFIKGVSQNLKWSAEVSKGAKLAGFLDTKALVETVTKIFKNGKEVIEPAYKIGKYGFENTKEFKTIVNAMQSSKGTNFIVSSQEEALKFLNKAFPGIKQEATGEASKFGYRLDVEETASGSLKQGHQGTHVNYYDKENKIWGNIEIKAK